MSRQRATPRELDVTINALNAEGLGVADLDGKPLHVRNGLPGETVTARILKRRKGVRYADAVDVVHPNVGRRGPACAYFPRCGGCNMHHMDYARQLQHKQQQLQDALALHEVRPVSWAPPRSAVRLGYRRKARLGVRLVGDQVLVGFRESFSNRVAKLSHCVVLTPALSALISPLKQLLSQFSIAGQIPQIELAQGDVQIAMLVRHLAPFTAQDMTLWRQFARQHDVEVLLQSGGYDTLVG
ncbi:MAG: TRAM domain-containing protein, partial [Pseudomonadota bacterium]